MKKQSRYLNQIKKKAALFFLLTCSCINPSLHAQDFNNLKTDPVFLNKLQKRSPSSVFNVLIYANSPNSFMKQLQTERVKIQSTDKRLPVMQVEATQQQISEWLKQNNILFISEIITPHEELLTGAVDYSCNAIRLCQTTFPFMDGASTIASIKEYAPDTSDIDLKGRFLNSVYTDAKTSVHANQMTTIIAGGGNTWHETKGVAPGARFNSSSFLRLIPEPDSFYRTPPVLVQNHSYGTINQNFYGIEAAAYDASTYEFPALLHVFSAGNEGTNTPGTGKYAGVIGFSNMTGNFKQAKNILTVGHTDSLYQVLPPSSKGPSYDGRIKPELVAYGEDGSSGAAAIVSGISLLLQQAYQSQHNGSTAPASLIKAILINGAKDVDFPGIDFRSGYGSADAYNSMTILQRRQYYTGTLTSNETKRFKIEVPQGISELKVTLSWTDPSALPSGTNKALINNLDLELQHPSSSQSWLPWVLNAFPQKDSLELPAERKRDTLNTTEQISIQQPQAGNYEIVIRGNALTTIEQSFSVAYSMDTTDTFLWGYPTKQDVVIPGNTILLRWKNRLAQTKGSLSLSVDAGQSWELINENTDLTKPYYRLTPPSIFAKALLRMQVNNQLYYSDTFSMAPRMQPKVAYHCPDSFRICWDKIPGIAQYKVFQLGDRYLQPAAIISDTSFGLLKKNSNSLYYAISPILNTQTLTRSYTFNYQTQGVDCYFKSFLSYLNGTRTELQLSLGSTYGIRAIRFEKRKINRFETLSRITDFNTLDFTTSDLFLQRGTNNYRVTLELNTGGEITSKENSIYFTDTEKALLYPNPLNKSSLLTILTDTTSFFQLFDWTGRMVYEKELNDFPETISLVQLQSGLYFYRFIQRNKLVKTGKLVIR
jgi:hypothetical protein